MPEYTNVKAPETDVESARKVKDTYDETWGDVLRFYVERRSEADMARKWTREEIETVAIHAVEREFRR